MVACLGLVEAEICANDAHFCGRRSRIAHIAPGAADSRTDRLHRAGRLRLHPPPRTPRSVTILISYMYNIEL